MPGGKETVKGLKLLVLMVLSGNTLLVILFGFELSRVTQEANRQLDVALRHGEFVTCFEVVGLLRCLLASTERMWDEEKNGNSP
ncbi:hypothetical protein [Granulicella arctica]|uniref:hypothetical protein n=1 Tax=Granulicella arctica TaxID=940613 RepID=UPI0021DFC657|nr:hypothetical protein [Granulicella arctica]